MNHKLIDDARGFTLIELLVGMFVAMLLIGAAATAFVLQNRASSVQQGTSDMQLSAQVAIEMLERDIRMAGFGIDRTTTRVLNNAYVSAGGVYDPDTSNYRVANSDGLFVYYSVTTATGVTLSPYYYYIERPNADGTGREGGLTRLNTATDAVETIASNVEDMVVTINADPTTGLPVVMVSLLIRSPFNDPSFTEDHPGITAADHPGLNVVANPVVNPAADHFRRRVYTTTIRPRNFWLN
ncbi:MAG: prepilin-type N-terminal cleavage/methylation domain-containing protein [Geobacteraceae bacterium]|nr:prepilin-type N-terminal cleavage/methylation domain-containing protein [Geobacteraceae bacterium]